jgi:predicted nuclease with TOPRIM domain
VKQARIIDKLEEDNAHLKDEVEELKRMQSRLLTKDDKQNETIHKLEGKLSELTGKVEMHFTAQKQLESTVNNLGERFEQMEFQHRSNDEPESAVEIEGSSLKRAKR